MQQKGEDWVGSKDSMKETQRVWEKGEGKSRKLIKGARTGKVTVITGAKGRGG